METLKIIGQILVVVFIVGGVVMTMTHRWQSKFTQGNLAKAFFWFGLICGALAIFTQYGFVYQVGTQSLFAEPTFYFLLGMVSMLGGIYINTEKRA
ncbi:MAG: hypothetical protein AAB402_01010 [Patescibacteria group bacterium]